MAAYVADAGRRALDRAEAAQALGEFRTNAAAAVPALVSALEDGDPLLRLDASFALWQIEPARVEQTLAILIENLRGSNPFHAYRAAIRLGEMGFAAKSAIPDLEQALQRRYEWDAAHDVVRSALKEVKRQSNERR
jgi:HEAT repeat protein